MIDDICEKIDKLTINDDKFNKLVNILNNKQYDHKKIILEEVTLKDAHIYCKINNIIGQISGSIIENFIIVKNKMVKNNSKNLYGDAKINNKNIEIKISLGGNKTHDKFNYVQIRFNHNVDYYILTAYYICINNVKNGGELYIFIINKEDMKNLIIKYGGIAHGTKIKKLIIGDLTNEILTEFSLRPKYNDKCWIELLNFRVYEINI